MKLVAILLVLLLSACDQPAPASDLPASASRTRDEVIARVAEIFPNDQAAVMAMLDEYAGDTEQGRNRVQWVIVEYSNGSIDRVRELVDLANIDYRDVLILEEQ